MLVLVFLHMTVLVGGAGFRGLAPVFCGVGVVGVGAVAGLVCGGVVV